MVGARHQCLLLSWGIWDAKLALAYFTDSDFFLLTNYLLLQKKFSSGARGVIGACLDSDLTPLIWEG